MAPAARKLARMRAVKGARRLMLLHLEQAETAVTRLPRADDAEALHDLRVALRHLRTYLSTYRKLFAESVPDKSREALRDLTRLTSPARDAEVQADWLAGQSRARRSAPGAASRLRSRLTEHHARLLRALRQRFTRDFPPLAARLRRQLERAEAPGRRSFGSYTAKQVVRHGRRLRERLARIEGMADVEGCHEARIAAKRVRYLLEPFDGLRGASRLGQRLKELQETLGQLHDLHMLLETLSAEPEGVPPRQGRGRDAELTRLASSARRRLARLYAQVEEDWLGDAAGKLEEALARVASTLDKAGRKRR